MRTKSIVAVAATIVSVAALGAFAPSASATHTGWAPASSATIHPGVQTRSPSGQCTANFVFTDATNVYIGQAAHCTGTGAATDTNGCDATSLPNGTSVTVAGAPGTMVYNSWNTMQQVGETDPDTCDYNDFALIELATTDHGKVNPSIPFWGGPVGIAGPTAPGEQVYSYGNSSLRLGLSPLSPKTGVSLGTDPSGWSHSVYTVSPGIPGDSGSAFLDADGNALGVLSTLMIAPVAGSNNVSDLASAIAYMETHTGLDVDLALGTEAFTGTGALPSP